MQQGSEARLLHIKRSRCGPQAPELRPEILANARALPADLGPGPWEVEALGLLDSQRDLPYQIDIPLGLIARPFEFGPLPFGRYLLRAQDPLRLRWVDLAAESKRSQLFEAGRSRRLELVDVDGRPLPGRAVALHPLIEDADGARAATGPSAIEVSDQDGCIHFDDLSGLSWELVDRRSSERQRLRPDQDQIVLGAWSERRFSLQAGTVGPIDGEHLHLSPTGDDTLAPHLSGERSEGFLILRSPDDAGELLAQAADKSWAEIPAGPPSHALRFRKPAQLSFQMGDVNDGALTGVLVEVRRHGKKADHSWRGRSDAEGRLSFQNLPPGDYSGDQRSFGAVFERELSFRLEAGETREQKLAFAGPREIIIRFRIEGQSRLPSSYRVGFVNAIEIGRQEYPERGELKLRIHRRLRHLRTRLILDADGYLPRDANLPILLREDVDQQLSIELHRPGAISVHVLPPADDWYALGLQRRQANGRFGRHDSAAAMTRHRHGRDYRIERLVTGTYRPFDRASGIVGKPFSVGLEGPDQTIQLDLTRSDWVEGQVTLDGSPLLDGKARVRLLGRLDSPRRFVEVDELGRFRIRVPGDRELSLVADHPYHRSDRTESRVRVREGEQGIELVLLPSPQHRFRCASADEELSLHFRSTKGRRLSGRALRESPGIYRFGGLPRGDWEVDVIPGDAARSRFSLRVGDEDSALSKAEALPGRDLIFDYTGIDDVASPMELTLLRRGPAGPPRRLHLGFDAPLRLSVVPPGRYEIMLAPRHLSFDLRLRRLELEVVAGEGPQRVDLGRRR